MKHLAISIALLFILTIFSYAQKQTDKTDELSVELAKHEADKKIDIRVDVKLFTSYQWPTDNVNKPVLHPIEVWGTRAKWMNLYGSIAEENISIAICDHPNNLNYSTYCHAHGYRLFSTNPLGVIDFTNKKEELNFFLESGKSIKFKYQIIVSSGLHFTDAELDTTTEAFAKLY